MADKIPVLFDTDIGSDIDDAVALAYLLSHPQCELVGITTVTGDVQKRAAMCEVLCATAGKPKIPIHCGRRQTLASGPGQPNVPQYDKVAGHKHRLDREENTAAGFIRKVSRERGKEVVLLSVGPFGNLAAAAALDAECLHGFRQVVSMAGKFFPAEYGEWNCRCDPASTAIVLHQKIEDHLLVGLDVTMQCQMSVTEVKKRFKGPLLEVVLKMAEAWFEHSTQLTFHDPLAAALVFHPDLCTKEKGLVHGTWPDDKGEGGVTPFAADPKGPHLACSKVAVDAFFEEYFSVF